jgi:hypothetical protein
LWKDLKRVFKNETLPGGEKEFFTTSGIFVYLIIISIASFKSPHYLLVILPLISVITARELDSWWKSESIGRFITSFHLVVMVILFAGLAYLMVRIENPSISVVLLALVALIAAVVFSSRYYPRQIRFYLPLSITVITFSFYLSSTLLPGLFQYQSAVQAGKKLNELNSGSNDVFSFEVVGNSLNALSFYYSDEVYYIYDAGELFRTVSAGDWIYTDEKGLGIIKEKMKTLNREIYLPHNSLQAPKGRFINPKTRMAAVENRYLIQI